ncbi:MAG: AAA family ATPase, partial [Caldilineaceae bacterium]|nr:AAA family ATPase [Caldilineaceae bacterium]
FFGAPLAHEQAVERAAECLLAVRQATPSIVWRAGVTFGTLWAGFRGGAERIEYGATGLVANMASRLAQRATWGEIWVDSTVQARVASRCHCTALGPMVFKGRSTPQPVFALQGRREPGSDEAHNRIGSENALIGRAAELATLREWVEQRLVTAGVALFSLYGEAGMGKSRLVQELRRQLPAARPICWLTCPADAILRQSLQPFRIALRAYFAQRQDATAEMNRRAFDDILAELLARLTNEGEGNVALRQELTRTRSFLGALLDLYWPDSLYATLEPELRFVNLLSAVTTLIHAEALLQPVVVYLEDSQWLDDDSQALLHELLRRPTKGHLLVLATVRERDATTEFLPQDPGIPQEWLHLTNLSVAAVQQHAAQVLGAPLTQDAAELLAGKSHGNPYFVEQLALELQRQEVFQYDAAG